MTTEIEIEGTKYVPSRLAAQALGYTQDYIGQLARKGDITAMRNAGMWYVHLPSVEAHKAKAESEKRIPPQNPHAKKVDAVVNLDGKEYISSSRGAEITGYSQDYVTQLARAGKITSKRIGSRWYVSKEELVTNKEKNDALLASVQAESVGFNKSGEEVAVHSDETLTYVGEEMTERVPALAQKARNGTTEAENGDKSYMIPIHVEKEPVVAHSSLHRVPSRALQDVSFDATENEEREPSKGLVQSPLLLPATVVVSLVVLAGGAVMVLGESDTLTNRGAQLSAAVRTNFSITDFANTALTTFTNLVTPKLIYNRNN